MATVIPHSHFRLAQRLRKYANETGATPAMVRSAYREGVKQLPDRTPESVSYSFGCQFRGVTRGGSAA